MSYIPPGTEIRVRHPDEKITGDDGFFTVTGSGLLLDDEKMLLRDEPDNEVDPQWVVFSYPLLGVTIAVSRDDLQRTTFHG